MVEIAADKLESSVEGVRTPTWFIKNVQRRVYTGLEQGLYDISQYNELVYIGAR